MSTERMKLNAEEEFCLKGSSACVSRPVKVILFFIESNLLLLYYFLCVISVKAMYRLSFHLIICHFFPVWSWISIFFIQSSKIVLFSVLYPHNLRICSLHYIQAAIRADNYHFIYFPGPVDAFNVNMITGNITIAKRLDYDSNEHEKGVPYDFCVVVKYSAFFKKKFTYSILFAYL